MYSTFRAITLFCLSAVSFMAAIAQQTDLDPVTVTATFNQRRTSQTGRNLTVISSDQLANLPAHSLDELLRYLPGIELQARGPFGAQSDVTLRGGTFQQVLVLVDGVRMNDANTGHFSTYIPIAAAEIDRIEVLKGATSALYGSDAVGGIIHIITKTFAAKTPVKHLQASAQLTGGEYGYYAVNAGLSSSTPKTSFGGGIVTNQAKGQQQRGIRGFVHTTMASASFGHRFNDRWQLAFRLAYDYRKFAAQNFYTSSLADTAQETIKTFWNQLQLIRSGKNNTMRVQGGFKTLHDSFAFNSVTPSNQNKTNLWQALVTNERRLGAKTVFTPGLQFINKRIISNDRGNHNVSQAAAFLLLTQQIGEHVFAAPAARLEWNERSGWELVPQISLSYRRSSFQLRASAGKTIRDADFTERFNNYNKPFVSAGQRLGNPLLEAERSFSYEAGGDYFFAKKLKLSVTYFQRLHKKLIDYVLTPASEIPRNSILTPSAYYSFSKNIAEVATSGYEADLQWQQQLAKQNTLWATAGVIWLNSSSSNTAPSLYISSHATFLGNFAVNYTAKRFGLSMTGVYKKRQPQQVTSPLIAPVSADYFLLNTKADVFVVQDKLGAFVEWQNILDRRYADLLGAQLPRRWLMAGIKLSFDKMNNQ